MLEKYSHLHDQWRRSRLGCEGLNVKGYGKQNNLKWKQEQGSLTLNGLKLTTQEIQTNEQRQYKNKRTETV